MYTIYQVWSKVMLLLLKDIWFKDNRLQQNLITSFQSYDGYVADKFHTFSDAIEYIPVPYLNCNECYKKLMFSSCFVERLVSQTCYADWYLYMSNEDTNLGAHWKFMSSEGRIYKINF